jgi:type IV secretion system protein VirB9
MKRSTFLKSVVPSGLGLWAGRLLAQDVQGGLSPDPRLVSFEFDQDQSYLILTRPKSVTLIQMAPNESIATAVAGDTVNFSVVVSASRNYVMVRPKYEGLLTSLSLITSERHYPLTLRSTKEALGKWYQRVQWTYPLGIQEEVLVSKSPLHAKGQERSLEPKVEIEQEREGAHPRTLVSNAQLTRIDLEHLNTAYSVQGEAEFRPLLVFDDGIRTYLKMPTGVQSLPALFALEQGVSQLVNYTVQSQHMVVQGLHSGFVLKLADTEVKVFKVQAVRSGFWERFKP